MADVAMVDAAIERRTSTSEMRGDEGEADAAWYLLPSAFASVVVPLSRARLLGVVTRGSTCFRRHFRIEIGVDSQSILLRDV